MQVLENEWNEKQMIIANLVDTADNNNWHTFVDDNGFSGDSPIFVAGTDISFSTTNKNDNIATITIVRLDQNGTELALSISRRVEVKHPYISGYLGFREAPIVKQMLELLDDKVRSQIDCILLDGNGILHPQKAGFACHVGISENIPSIGVSKSLLCIDGISEARVRGTLSNEGRAQKSMNVVGDSGFIWAKALITGNAIHKPIYTSIGHKVSLQTATRLVKSLCTYRIPEPIRFADMHSRSFLRGDEVYVYRPELFENQRS